MQLKQALKKKRSVFIRQWFEATIKTYPKDTARFLIKDSDRFDNPVGSTTRETVENVFDHLQEDFTRESLETLLDPVIRIRAVQSFAPADVVSFIFALKQIGQSQLEADQSREFDAMVDQIALAGFNRLMKCKEDIFLLKATESKRRIHRAFERAGLVEELTEEELIGSEKS